MFTVDGGQASILLLLLNYCRVPKPRAAWTMLLNPEDLDPNAMEKLQQEKFRATLLVPSPPSPKGTPYTSWVHLWPQGRRRTYSKIKLDPGPPGPGGVGKNLVISERWKPLSFIWRNAKTKDGFLQDSLSKVPTSPGCERQRDKHNLPQVLPTLLLTLPPLRTGIFGDF